MLKTLKLGVPSSQVKPSFRRELPTCCRTLELEEHQISLFLFALYKIHDEVLPLVFKIQRSNL